MKPVPYLSLILLLSAGAPAAFAAVTPHKPTTKPTSRVSASAVYERGQIAFATQNYAAAMRVWGLMRAPFTAEGALIKQSKPARSRNIRFEMQIGDSVGLKRPVQVWFEAWTLIGS